MEQATANPGAPDGASRHPIGAQVIVRGAYPEDKSAVVVYHGRDSHGIYTEVRFADGQTERFHRNYLVAAKDEGKRCKHGIRLPWECKDCLYEGNATEGRPQVIPPSRGTP